MKKSTGKALGVVCAGGVLFVVLLINTSTNYFRNSPYNAGSSLELHRSPYQSHVQRTLKSSSLDVESLNSNLALGSVRQCQDYHNVNSTNQCNYIKNTSDCEVDDGFINYLIFLHCYFSPKLQPLGLVILFVWLIYLFIGLGTTAEDFFCPALTVISHTLKLSQNMAGVTFLAFGNGAPDIFSAIAAITGAKNGDAGLAVGALFGAGIFVTTVVAGTISVVQPFKVAERPFLRDTIFYLAAAYWTFVVLWDGKITLGQAIGFIGLYVFYVIVVMVGRKIYQYHKKNQKDVETNNANEANYNQRDSLLTDSMEVDPDGYKEFCSINSSPPSDKSHPTIISPSRALTGVLNVTEQVTVTPLFGSNPLLQPHSGSTESDLTRSNDEMLPLLGHRSQLNQWQAFLYGINPIDSDEWNDMKFYGKAYEVFKAPLQFFLQLTIPVVDYDKDKHGWNRILNTLHIITGPVFCALVTKGAFIHIHKDFILLELVICVCLLLAILILFTSKHDTHPIYHWVFAYVGFIVAVLWIYSIANEIVNLLEMYGMQFNISNAILGLTLLAWGNSIGDLISNTTMAKQGFPGMGMSACFGGPMFNMLMGIGISCTIATIKNNGVFKLNHNLVQTILAGGLALSLISSMIIMLITKFHATRLYGIYLWLLYVVFLVVAILAELHVVVL